MANIDLSPPRAANRNLFAAGFVLAGFLASALMWAMGAEIATTLRVPGAISPTAPTHNVQHEQGGRIAQVHVALHDHVVEGQPLFDMDFGEAEVRLRTLRQSAAELRAEIAEAEHRLAAPDILKVAYKDAGSAVGQAFSYQDLRLAAEVDMQRTAARAAEDQLDVLDAQIGLQRDLLAVVDDRVQKTGQLNRQGLAAETALEQLQQRALQLRVSETSVEARRRSLEAEIARAEQQVDMLIRTRRQALADLKLSNLRRLIQIDGEIDGLVLRQSAVRILAPVSGQITDLTFAVSGLVVPPGQTMAVISQPLQAPGIDLRVPARLADQVKLGQDGQLTIDSLPQRNAPILRVRVTKLASEPVRDDNGNASYYAGAAELFEEDIDLARAALGEGFQLAVGMPVNVALNGSETTFWTYLTAPFAAMWDGAFED